MNKKNPLPLSFQNPNGLHSKFALQKIIGHIKNKPIFTDIKPGEEYFVLRLDDECMNREHLRACKLAIIAYANEIEKTLPKVATEIRERYLNA